MAPAFAKQIVCQTVQACQHCGYDLLADEGVLKIKTEQGEVKDAQGNLRFDVDYHVNAYARDSGWQNHLCFHARCYHCLEQYDTRGLPHQCFVKPVTDAEDTRNST